MPRPARRDIVFPGALYHVYARGNDGTPTFREAGDYVFYIDLINELRQVHAIRIYHFALMPNHVHLLLEPENPSLSLFMKNLQNRYTKRFCKKYSFGGHLWQGRFKNKPIDNDAYLFACGKYIELNPVRAGLVDDAALWPYSSYRYYAFGEQKGPVETDPFYANLGRTDEERQASYRAHTDKVKVPA